METQAVSRLENFINNWNAEFPNYLLTVPDLKKPNIVIGALFEVFRRLGIDIDVVVMLPPEKDQNQHMIYYRDLIPIINTTRVSNYLVSGIPQMQGAVSVTHFLQPTANTSHYIILMLFNLMIFNEERLRAIQPYQQELFDKMDEVKTLEDKRNQVIEMLNEQAKRKTLHAEELEKLDKQIKQLEDDIKPEKGAHEIVKQELEELLKEKHQSEMLLEQKKGQRDNIMAEVDRKRALRVYDAEDVKAQMEQATQNVQKAEEKLESMRIPLMERENGLKHLQALKPNIVTANNLLHEIMKLSTSFKEQEIGDLDLDSQEGELEMLTMDVNELTSQLEELRTALDDITRQDAQNKRQQERLQAESEYREAEEKNKRDIKLANKLTQRIEEINQLLPQYEQQKAAGLEQLAEMKETLNKELGDMDALLIKTLEKIEKKVEEKLQS